jgi:tetratricopeptide (TPR) repeat protein
MVGIAACASNPPRPAVPAPSVSAFPTPVVPASLRVSADIRARHDAAWRKLQAGDARGAGRDFSSIVRRNPGFYPSVTGLGFIDLSSRAFKNAVARFETATRLDDAYLPAWLGLAEAALGANDDATAVAAMERALVLDPRQPALRSRLELVRFRQIQTLIAEGRAERTAGKLTESKATLERALALSPSSVAILRELVATETSRGDLGSAEMYARRATDAEPRDGETWMALAGVLDAARKYREASTAASRAVALDARPEWRERAAEYRAKAEAALLPAAFANLPKAASVTRGEAAAFVGIKLEDLIEKAPRRSVGVATDVRGHWAASWILGVTRAGVMEIYPNHTFQPGATLRRSDLARMASALVPLAGAKRPADVQRWRASRPAFTDLASTHASYRVAALAVASGTMTSSGGRFEPTRAATGAELAAVVARVAELAN